MEEFYFGGVDVIKTLKNEMICEIINGIRKYKEITQR